MKAAAKRPLPSGSERPEKRERGERPQATDKNPLFGGRVGKGVLVGVCVESIKVLCPLLRYMNKKLSTAKCVS